MSVIPEGWWLVVLKSFFDGAQTANNDRVTLACVCATGEQWNPVEEDWKRVVAENNSTPWHTTNAYALRKEFKQEKGWTNEKVNAYASACADALEGSLAQPGRILVPTPLGYLPNIVKAGLNGLTMTIPVQDFRRARDVVEDFPNSVAELCLSETLGFVLRYGKRLKVDGYMLYFDRNEPFYGHALERWNSKKYRKDVPEVTKVASITEAEMASTPALQIADLFAWCLNHKDNVRRDWHKRVNDLHWDSYILTYEYLINPTPGALKRTSAWGLPKRKKT